MKSFIFVLLIFISLIGRLSHAEVEFKFNGFATIAAGKIMNGDVAVSQYVNYECPCFITDYNNAGIYEESDGWNFEKESRIGLQLNTNFTDKFSLITQIVYRAIDSEVSLEWAYLSYDFTPNLTLQVGRKRIPLYYYSDFQDVGFAYIWARPPQALYGWEASNYNGASIRYNTDYSDWTISSSLYAGSETVDDAPYNDLYYDVHQDSRWENIVGFDIDVSKDWFDARLVYMTSDNSTTDKPFDNSFYTPPTKQTVLGLAIKGDFESWFFLSEFNINQREDKADGLRIRAPATMIGFGIPIDRWTPFISWSRYWDMSNNLDLYEPERFIDLSFTLRYDLNSSSALKLQWDKYRDKSLYDFVGNTNVLTLAYDVIF